MPPVVRNVAAPVEPTADTGAVDQVQQVVRLVGDVLGRGVIGVYLHGSAVLGGLRPASDLDVLVVSRRCMHDQQRRALLEGLFTISGSTAGARPVELTVVVQSEVRPWRFPPTGDFSTESGCATNSRPAERRSRNRCRTWPY